MTSDHRVITGAHLEAIDLQSVLVLAEKRWKDVGGFHHVEVWLGTKRLTSVPPPVVALAISRRASVTKLPARLNLTNAPPLRGEVPSYHSMQRSRSS